MSDSASIDQILAQHDPEKRVPAILRHAKQLVVGIVDPLGMTRRVAYWETLREAFPEYGGEHFMDRSVNPQRADALQHGAAIACIIGGFAIPAIAWGAGGVYLARFIGIVEVELAGYDLLHDVCRGEPQ